MPVGSAVDVDHCAPIPFFARYSRAGTRTPSFSYETSSGIQTLHRNSSGSEFVSCSNLPSRFNFHKIGRLFGLSNR
jgi:hypothetical protein